MLIALGMIVILKQKKTAWIKIIQLFHKPVIFTTIGNGRDVKNIQDHGRKKKFSSGLQIWQMPQATSGLRVRCDK